MGITNIEILECEDKVAKNGKSYTRFRTDQGWCSAFEKDVIDALKSAAGQISVDLVEKGDFKNIRAVVKNQEADMVNPIKIATPTTSSIDAREASKQAGVATRYAVDLCIAGKIELDAIKDYAGIILRVMSGLAKSL